MCLLLSSWSLSSSAAEVGGLTGLGTGLDSSFSADYPQQELVEEFNQSLSEISAFDSGPSPESRTPGEIRFYKNFTTTGVYDSNIRLDFQDPRDDFYFLYTPTIGFIKGRKDVSKLYVESFYELSYLDYIEDEKLSRFNHSWVTKAIYKTPKLKLDLFNNFQPQSARMIGDRTELRSGGASQIVADADSLRLVAAYEISPKITLSHTYRFQFLNFTSHLNATRRSVKRFSHQDHVFTPRLSYKLATKSTAYAEYSYRIAEYFNGGEFGSRLHGINAGVLTKLTPKTGVNLELGWRFRNYDESYIRDGDGLSFKAALTHKISEKLSATFYAAQDLTQSLDVEGATLQTQSTNQEQNFFGTTITWKASSRAEILLDGTVGFSHRDGDVRLPDPDNSRAVHSRERDEEIYGWGIAWKWNPGASTDTLLSYRFVNKNSSFKAFEYDDHRMTGSVRVRF